MPRHQFAWKMFFILVCAIGLTAAAWPQDSDKDDRKAMWKKVEVAVGKGLPQTAIDQLDPIIKSALSDKQYDEAVKAISQRITLEGMIQGNRAEEKITRLEAAMADQPEEVQPMLEALLAHWYWHYFQQNRWRFNQRTQTAASPSSDIQTWALPQILAEIDKHFSAAFKDADRLKKIPVHEWSELLIKGTMDDRFRPTLYDFLAHEALNFYQTGEQAGSQRSDAFEMMADGPIFSDTDTFLQWKVDSTDDTSPIRKGIALFQDLMAFHRSDDDPLAMADLELARYVFGNNHAFGEDKASRYRFALKRFAEEHRALPIYARAQAALSGVSSQENDFVDARKQAQLGLDAFPKSVGGALCYNLIQRIEAKSLTIRTERVWNDPAPKTSIQYKNLDKIFCKLIPHDVARKIAAGNVNFNLLKNNAERELSRSIRDWTVDLPETTDFQIHNHLMEVPLDIPKGAYWLVISANEDFGETDNQVDFTNIWRSDLAVVLKDSVPTGENKNSNRGFVLDANTGTPIANAKIRYWIHDRGNRNQRPKWVPQKERMTDDNGLFTLPGVRQKQVIMLASKDDDMLGSDSQYLYSRDYRNRDSDRTVFFTDRSIYRPGQTISFKGICLSLKHSVDQYKTVSDRKVKVSFRDANNQEVASQQLQTNDFGSFKGSFTAPRDRVTGQMSIRVVSGPNGATSIRVEEYKRPKFDVDVELPTQEVRLGEPIAVKGKATAYTGAAIDGASVKWRVVRQVRYPNWWYWRCWWIPPGNNNSKEIAHGSTSTDALGNFDIEFVATPDPAVSKASEPTFQYLVYADVTDTAGETRSDQQTVNAGFTAIKASLTIANTKPKLVVDGDNSGNQDSMPTPPVSNSAWLVAEDTQELTIKIQTLNDLPATADGKLTIYGLEGPTQVHRAKLGGRNLPYRFSGIAPIEKPENMPIDWSNLNAWPIGEEIQSEKFECGAEGQAMIAMDLPAGVYRAKVQTKDRFGTAVHAELTFHVLDPSADKLTVKIPELLAAPSWKLKVGQELTAMWGSGYDSARCFVEVIHKGKLLQQFWTDPNQTQVRIRQKVSEAMRGGFTLRTMVVRENRLYFRNQHIDVPWDNKDLTVKWEHFVSKLKPGAEDVWTAVVSGPDARKLTAEMVATLYDASLDAFAPHNFVKQLGGFRQDYSIVNARFQNSLLGSRRLYGYWRPDSRSALVSYRSFPPQLTQGNYGYRSQRFLSKSRGSTIAGVPAPSARANNLSLGLSVDQDMVMDSAAAPVAGGGEATAFELIESAIPSNGAGTPDLDQVAARTNLNETAFFFPHLVTDKDGTVRISFTMPEALTEWKFMALAHDNEMRSGYLEGTTVTAKDLMVQPNPPRFLREGDELEFTVKVSNQSPTQQQGTVRLTFADARTLDNVDEQLANQQLDKEFDIPSMESRSISWRIKVPDSLGVLTYKAVGSTGRLSDGEEAFLPVLSRRVMVTESLPMPLLGKTDKVFEMERLIDSAGSDSLENKSMTIQMVSNPSWYAVMALPYLMEYPHQCSEQIFNRYYANRLARHIAKSDPKIRRVFDQWKGTDALDSPLEKNEDLKAILIQETPWLLAAKNESEARRNVGILFDENRLTSEMNRALMQLRQQQLHDGQWPWFPGGAGSNYITLYITTGFARLRHLGTEADMEAAIKAVGSLDTWMRNRYDNIKHKDKYVLSSTDALYLYCRSFYQKDVPVNPSIKESIDFFLDAGRKRWLKIGRRQSKAQLALALKRYGQVETAKNIMRSIKEHSVVDEEMGRYWRDTEFSIWWYQAPIETQAVMIEAFDEVMGDAQAVEDCKVWLLKQKQTRNWKTTKATADAIYAMLLRGSDLLASDELVSVEIAGKVIEPEKVEAGTGFYEKRFAGAEITPDFGKIHVVKKDDGVSWGAAHWQYLEDMSKVSLYDGTPLKVTKDLYRSSNSNQGPVLEKVDGPISIGEKLVVRITIRTDRDMEFVHLKDFRGSGTEPVDVISRYQYQDGLAYYQSTKDTATHFFIDYLPKGVYVFEYSLRPQHAGRYQTGFANLQSMYAPEFGGHSESIWLDVTQD